MPETVTTSPASIAPAVDRYRPPLNLRLLAVMSGLQQQSVRMIRRAVSAPLGLQWKFDVTVLVDAVVYADDAAAAALVLRQYLNQPAMRMVVACLSDEPLGWCELLSIPVARVRDVITDAEHHSDGWSWEVSATATVTFTLAARDADADLDLDLDPLPKYQRPFGRITVRPVQTGVRVVRRLGGKHR
jgi:hypothetical protein